MADGDGSVDDLFEDDFGAALDEAASSGGEGLGDGLGDDDGFGGAPPHRDGEVGGPGFDGEYDDDLDRVDLGIDGLDSLIQGGVPRHSLIATVGSAGTGKTTFALQFLDEGLRAGERAVYLSLEERRTDILRAAAEKGWPFRQYVEDGQLAIVDFDPIEMANSLTSIGNELPALIEEFGATRVVLDSVSLLEMMYHDQATRRSEVYDFTRSLKRAGVTTVLTSEADGDNPFASRYHIIEHLTDAVIVLRYVRSEDFRETRLAIEILKIRNANHSRETKPYEITDTGLNVYRQANLF